MKRRTKVIIAIMGVILVIIIGFLIYVSDYYKADSTAIKLSEESSLVEKKDNLIIFKPEKENDKGIGFIFYPGGKVDSKSYSPLLMELSKQGITCFLVEMPFNLAVFNVDAANDVIKASSDINSWYIGGHSLGGAMASSYLNGNNDKIKGLILLGAYPTSDNSINSLIIYGENDKVLDRGKLKKCGNIEVITGGNHSYFGNYGEQKGDGKATISRQRQQEVTVDLIRKFILDNKKKNN